jgi:hypothetical protein
LRPGGTSWPPALRSNDTIKLKYFSFLKNIFRASGGKEKSPEF